MTGLWRVVSVVVPAKTKSKVVFLYDLNKMETRLQLQQYVDLNELEQPYGLREKMTLDKYLATEPPLNIDTGSEVHERSKPSIG